MSDPFRDDKAALIERVAQLQAENHELRERLDEERAARGENREAVTRRLSEENRELHSQLRELREELSQARARSRNASSSSLADWVEVARKLFRGE